MQVVDVVAPALESLEDMLRTEGPNSYDFAFIGETDQAVRWLVLHLPCPPRLPALS